jgi:hypothetical protein
MIVDRITAGTDPAKPIAFTLGRNCNGAHALLGDHWIPVRKAVLEVLKRHFMVVLRVIDEYLTSLMCHDCHNTGKLIPGGVNLIGSTALALVVTWIATSTLS